MLHGLHLIGSNKPHSLHLPPVSCLDPLNKDVAAASCQPCQRGISTPELPTPLDAFSRCSSLEPSTRDAQHFEVGSFMGLERPYTLPHRSLWLKGAYENSADPKDVRQLRCSRSQGLELPLLKLPHYITQVTMSRVTTPWAPR